MMEERDRLAEIMKKRNLEIENFHIEVEILTSKIQEVSNKRQEYSTRNLMAEIEDLTEQIRRNEGELNKEKSIINLKD
jgi:tellurite resistance protein